MRLWHALLLGILQGATEFLPVSSSGHLVLVPWALGWPSPSVTFDALAHLGTLLAVVVYFWPDVVALLRGWWRTIRLRRIDTPDGRLAWLIVVSAIPGGVAGLLLDDWFESLFGSPAAVGAFLLLTGALLYASDRMARGARAARDADLGDALAMGVAQAMAIAPGISRSGATISAGLWRGLARDGSARLSFLMGIPIIAAASLKSLVDASAAGTTSGEWLALAIGFIAAAASGYVAVRSLVRYVASHSLRPFAYYCWAAGALALVRYALRAG